MIDLFPPGPFDPAGLHNLVWEAVGQKPISFDPGRPIQFSSYRAGRSTQAFIEPRRVGEELPVLPLFLSEEVHVSLPLPRSYGAAFARLPAHLRHEFEERPACIARSETLLSVLAIVLAALTVQA